MPHFNHPIASRLPRVGTTIFTVMSRLAQECGAINLSQGFPDFSAPQRLFDLVTRHMTAGHNQYAPMPGAASLREAIAEKVENLYGAKYSVDQEITVTAGATQAIYTAIAACVRPGDEVIVFAPVYDSYVPGIELNGGKAVYANLGYPDYRPDWDEVRRLVSLRTRMIIINSPHNPSGAVWSSDDLEQLAELVRGTDIVIVSDEVYEHVVFAGVSHVGLSSHAELRSRSFVVSSFGKTYHITGWKVAYCLAPQELMNEFRKAHQFVVFVVNHPMQLALADFMREQPRFPLELAAFYQGKRDFFRAQLADSRFKLLPCAATYFQLARYAAISDEPDTLFARRLAQEHGVAVIPVSVFYPQGDDHRIVRFCFAKGDETLAAAGERLRRV